MAEEECSLTEIVAGLVFHGTERSPPAPQTRHARICYFHLFRCLAPGETNRGHAVSAYGATKYAVRGLAQQVAAEYATNGIRANSISPGSAYLLHEVQGVNFY